MALHTPYLEAIQAVPGDTPSEKFRWISNLIKERLDTCGNLEEALETEKIPRMLLPLVQIEAAKIFNKTHPEAQSSYEAIAESLKSEDSTVICRALRATHFFDGSNEKITNVDYFFDHLFPFVTLNTRLKIIKALARCLSAKHQSLAEKFFVAVDAAYGIKNAVHLLPACSDSFSYNVIVERNLVLPRIVVKILFRKNPDFVVRYFRLSKPSNEPSVREIHPICIHDYSDFLVKLIKRRIDAFIELYEMHNGNGLCNKLSNKRTLLFFKYAKERFLEKPQLYIDLIPLKMISASQMESIFSKLLPEKLKQFDTDSMIRYLEYYPEEKRATLLLKSYQEVYGKNLLDESENVTIKLMKLLPVEERIKQARIKMEATQDENNKNCRLYYNHSRYEDSWRCFLPTQEIIPILKQEISKSSDIDNRLHLVQEMLYCCSINKDDAAFVEVLRYVADRHRNEQSYFLSQVIETTVDLYNLTQINEEAWSLLQNLFHRIYVKDDYYHNMISMKILEAAMLFNLTHNLPTAKILEMIVHIQCTGYGRTHWNILSEHPQYERKFLEDCFAYISKIYNNDSCSWKDRKTSVINELVRAIYVFNDTHVKLNGKIEPMSIKNYPWLLKEIDASVKGNDSTSSGKIDTELKAAFLKYEKDLYDLYWRPSIVLGNAFTVLRQKPEYILENYKYYAESCERHRLEKNVKIFIRAIRWYKDIPIKFAEWYIQEVKTNESSTALSLLALLLHGHTFARLIEPMLPVETLLDVNKDNAKHSYVTILTIVTDMNILNPPAPLDYIARMCEGDYLSLALTTLINTCRRTSQDKVIAFAKMLSDKRISLKKHGIRLMHMTAKRDQLYEFILNQWQSEKNNSIREVLMKKAIDLFCNDANPTSWSFVLQMIMTVTLDDEVIISDVLNMIDNTPNDYIPQFVTTMIKMLDHLEAAGLKVQKLVSHTTSLLERINDKISNLLSEELNEQLLRRYLFHSNLKISEAARSFAINSYLLPAGDKFDKRMNTFSVLFVETVKNGWNVSHPKKSLFYPINHTVCKFIQNLVYMFDYNKVNPPIFEATLKTFLSVLTPQMSVRSYLLLVYAKEVVKTKIPKEFGMKFARMLPELIEIFSPYLVPLIEDTLHWFLGQHVFPNYETVDINFGIMEGLLESGSVDAVLIAVRMLPPGDKEIRRERYVSLLNKFAAFEHPAMKCILCELNNKRRYDEAFADD